MKMAYAFGLAESNGYLLAVNPNSTAKGIYQYLDTSTITASNRLYRLLKEEWVHALQVGSISVLQLDWEQQTVLLLADLLERKGSDKVMVEVMRGGSYDSISEAYYKLHHTAPDEIVERNWKRKTKAIWRDYGL